MMLLKKHFNGAEVQLTYRDGILQHIKNMVLLSDYRIRLCIYMLDNPHKFSQVLIDHFYHSSYDKDDRKLEDLLIFVGIEKIDLIW